MFSPIAMALPLDVFGRISHTRTVGFVDTQPLRFNEAFGIHFHFEHIYPGKQGSSHLSYLPLNTHIRVYDYAFEPLFIRKRNERERLRVRCVNEGYARLRQHLPHELEEKRLSKVETLRAAISYIKHLQELLSPGLARAAETCASMSSVDILTWIDDGEQ